MTPWIIGGGGVLWVWFHPIEGHIVKIRGTAPLLNGIARTLDDTNPNPDHITAVDPEGGTIQSYCAAIA